MLRRYARLVTGWVTWDSRSERAILSVAPARSGVALQGSDGLVNGGEQVVGSELLQDRAVLEVVVDLVRRPGYRDGHTPPPDLGDQVTQRLQPGVVDVGHAGGVEDDCVHRARRGVHEVADPQAEVNGVAVPQRRVDQVDQDPGYLLGRKADVGRDPVIGARCSSEDGIAGPGGAPGAVGQRKDQREGYALLDANDGDGYKRSGGKSELDPVEAENGPQLTARKSWQCTPALLPASPLEGR